MRNPSRRALFALKKVVNPTVTEDNLVEYLLSIQRVVTSDTILYRNH